MKWAELTTRERRVVVLGGCVIAAALIVRLLVLPYVAAVREARDSLDREWTLLRTERALLREAADYPDAFAAVGAQFLAGAPRLLAGRTPAAAQAQLARQIDGAAGEMILTRVEPLPPRVLPTGYFALPLRVEGEGDLEAFLFLLAVLEGGPTMLHLEDLSVEVIRGRSALGGAGPDPLSFRFTVTGFALNENALRGRTLPHRRPAPQTR